MADAVGIFSESYQMTNGIISHTDIEPIVTQRFVQCPFPDQAKVALMTYGGMPMQAVVWKRLC
jgi:hypothetical protein